MPAKVMTEEVCERVAELRLQKRTWEQIAEDTGVSVQTLKRWRTRPEMAEARRRVLGRLPGSIIELAQRVLMKRLEAELEKSEPDVGLAERLVERTVPGFAAPKGEGGPLAQAAVQVQYIGYPPGYTRAAREIDYVDDLAEEAAPLPRGAAQLEERPVVEIPAQPDPEPADDSQEEEKAGPPQVPSSLRARAKAVAARARQRAGAGPVVDLPDEEEDDD